MQQPPDGLRVYTTTKHEDFYENHFSGMGTVWLWSATDDGRLLVYAIDRQDGVALPPRLRGTYAVGAWVSAKGWELRDYLAN